MIAKPSRNSMPDARETDIGDAWAVLLGNPLPAQPPSISPQLRRNARARTMPGRGGVSRMTRTVSLPFPATCGARCAAWRCAATLWCEWCARCDTATEAALAGPGHAAAAARTSARHCGRTRQAVTGQAPKFTWRRNAALQRAAISMNSLRRRCKPSRAPCIVGRQSQRHPPPLRRPNGRRRTTLRPAARPAMPARRWPGSSRAMTKITRVNNDFVIAGLDPAIHCARGDCAYRRYTGIPRH